MPKKLNPFFKPLPTKLVNRLRLTTAKRLERHGKKDLIKSFERLENVDHRKKMSILEKNVIKELKKEGLKAFFTKPGKIDSRFVGGRVRELNVSRNFPGVRVILKRIHSSTALKTIQRIKGKVQEYNKTVSAKNHEVVMPDVHLLAENLVAMQEIKGLRGKALTETLKKNKIPRVKYYLELGKACNLLRILPDQMEFVGMHKGKLVFMPLIDLF